MEEGKILIMPTAARSLLRAGYEIIALLKNYELISMAKLDN